jgi:DNA-directed RNA polymerase subunit beta
MQSLGLDVKVLTENNEEIEIEETPEYDTVANLDEVIGMDTVANEEEIFEEGGFSEAEPDFNGDIVMVDDSEERF